MVLNVVDSDQQQSTPKTAGHLIYPPSGREHCKSTTSPSILPATLIQNIFLQPCKVKVSIKTDFLMTNLWDSWLTNNNRKYCKQNEAFRRIFTKVQNEMFKGSE